MARDARDADSGSLGGGTQVFAACGVVVVEWQLADAGCCWLVGSWVVASSSQVSGVQWPSQHLG